MQSQSNTKREITVCSEQNYDDYHTKNVSTHIKMMNMTLHAIHYTYIYLHHSTEIMRAQATIIPFQITEICKHLIIHLRITIGRP